MCARVILLAAEDEDDLGKACGLRLSVTVTINFNLFLSWGMGIGIHTLVSHSCNWGGIPVSCSAGPVKLDLNIDMVSLRVLSA